MSYVELHTHSYFSLLDGASSPRELVARAAALGLSTLALTDHDAVYGAVEFATAAREVGIRPIHGAELTLHDGSHLTLLVKNENGWGNLCTLITKARANAPKGDALLPEGALTEHTDGLIALSGCRRGGIAQAIIHHRRHEALRLACHYRDLFGADNFFLELQHHSLPVDAWLNQRLHLLGGYLGIGCVVTNNVHYATRDGRRLQDVLVCIRNLTTLDESERLRRPNSEYCLKSAETMHTLFADYPDALANTQHIADRCTFELHFGLQHLPTYPTPQRTPAVVHLRDLCEAALEEKAEGREMKDERRKEAREQLRYELGVIERGGLANYFLIVWDIVRFSRENGILCQGRGSAANSLVAYLLDISPIDPLVHDLVFERFLSDERRNVPDIDIDFDAARREEVIQYVYRRYGHDHVAMACTVSTFRTKAAIRDVSKVLGLSAEHTAQAHDILHGYEPDNPISPQLRQVVEICEQLRGLPRHLGIHNGGIIITAQPLHTRIPIEPATMENRTVVQWDKDSLDLAGMVKIDVLGLRMLSAIDEAERLVRMKKGRGEDQETRRWEEEEKTTSDLQVFHSSSLPISPSSTLPVSHSSCLPTSFDDPAVYAMISEADTMGVFQVESRAQAQTLPRMQPRNFNDIVVEISLIRPGPVQGNMVNPFLQRRMGKEPVTYLHPSLKPALEETLGVILFQEQVLKVARDVAGFSAGQGEQLRRALGKKNAYEAIEALRVAFVEGAIGRGVSAEIAAQIFEQLKAFGGYSFAKSHAAAFAVLVYQSAWLRKYHQAEFFTAIFNNSPMGFWSPAVLTGDARRHGINVLPVDIIRSQARCTVEDGNIRLGFNYVKRFGEEAIERLTTARQRQPFRSLGDLCRRTKLPRRLVENLVTAGALDAWGQRRQLIWQLGTLAWAEDMLPIDFSAEPATLPELSEAEAQGLEIGVVGLSTGRHVMAQLRPKLPPHILTTRSIDEAVAGRRVVVAGLLVIRQQPQTAKGFVFLTLEDEFGLFNIVVRPKIATRYRKLLHTTRLLSVSGTLERQGAITNVLATHITPL